MVKKRPCRICHRWFQPHPRVGDRQRVCSRPECQSQRNRRSAAAWRRRNPEYWREGRLRERIRNGESRAERELTLREDPLRQLDWGAVQNAVGLETAVILEESAKVLLQWTRNGVQAELAVIKGLSGREVDVTSQMQIGRPRPPP